MKHLILIVAFIFSFEIIVSTISATYKQKHIEFIEFNFQEGSICAYGVPVKGTYGTSSSFSCSEFFVWGFRF